MKEDGGYWSTVLTLAHTSHVEWPVCTQEHLGLYHSQYHVELEEHSRSGSFRRVKASGSAFQIIATLWVKSGFLIYFFYQSCLKISLGSMVAQHLALLRHSAWVRFQPWVTVCVEFAHSPRVCV
eukprot:g25202.t1